VNFLENLDDSNSIGVKFILTDLDLALTFLDVAANSADPEVVRRNYDNALKAYTTVVDLLERLSPDEQQRHELEAKLTIVRARLGDVRE